MKRLKRVRPWIDENGKKYSDDILRVVSKDWDQKTWDRYLTETVDVPQRELILKEKGDVENHSEESHYQFFKESFPKKKRDNLKSDLDMMMEELPQKECVILKMLFYEGLTPSKVAKRIGIDASSVRRLRKKGIELLKGKLKSIEVNKKQKGAYL